MPRGVVAKMLDRVALTAAWLGVTAASVILIANGGRGTPAGQVTTAIAACSLCWLLGRAAWRLRRAGHPGLAWAAAVCWTVIAAGAIVCAFGAELPSSIAALGWMTVRVLLPVGLVGSDAGWLLLLRPHGLLARAHRVVILGTAALSALLWWSLPWLAPVGVMSGSATLGLGALLGWCFVTAVSHALMPALMRRDARVRAEAERRRGDRALATLQCPRCQLWVQMHSGVIRCPGCSLQVRLEFEEPRCACGYPLHRLSGPNCPECGLEVPPERRWGAARGPAAAPVPAEPA